MSDVASAPAMRRLQLDPVTILGLVVLAVLIATAVLAPWISPYGPTDINPATRLQPPSGEHWLGTDRIGRDVLTRALHGGRISLTVGFLVGVAVLCVGVLLGLLAGSVRWLDGLIMRVIDGIMAMPAVLVGVAMVVMWGGGLWALLIAIGIPSLPDTVRLTRSLALSIRTEPYVEAARMGGTRLPMLLWRHFIPNALAPLIVIGTYVGANAIVAESLLSFLGVGMPPEMPSWGNMIAEGRLAFQIAPWGVFVPALFLTATVLAVNLVGDGLRDSTDPLRLKSD
ncbi:ABC transporter permease [Devosia ginsengisoli]|uniref:ABC transporter permease n=1 Tax=Devosia ginsengisoli TaxID=400770 RepID=A0A5B8LSE2_9HYPH|nr:ABC transporter permease [Devosia ginsengisoli]QDZ10574.1 ABC transporter permease [Devosia ginsengisoli]